MKKLITITRSFSYKKNVGNYETRDFFCSQQAECYEDEAETVSEALYQFCKEQVIKAVNSYQEPYPQAPIVYKKGVDPDEKRETDTHERYKGKREDKMYMATERDESGANRVPITGKYRGENTGEPF